VCGVQLCRRCGWVCECMCVVCSCVEGVDEVSVLSPELLLPDSTVKIKRSTCADVRKNLTQAAG
jgi:hypothetical protein